MDLHDRDEGRLQVIRLGFVRVHDRDWEQTPRDREDRAAVEIRRELLGV